MHLRTGVCGLALAFACTAVAAAPAQPSGAELELVKELHRGLARSFQLPREMPLDPDLRMQASEIATAHLAHVDEIMLGWVREERKLQSAGGKALRPNAVFFAAWARMLNELALWQVEPGDAQYERATLEVLESSPQTCQSWGDPRFSDYANRVMRIQAMPAVERPAALAAERALLAHWGQPRAAIPPLPYPLPQDGALAAIKRLQDGGERPKLALSPMLASALLSKKMAIKDLHPETQCALQQWWMNVGLKQGSTPAAALAGFRYGTMITARMRLAGMFENDDTEGAASNPAGRPSYPKLASRFDVTGVTTIGVKVNDEGKPVDASVLARKIEVTGIRGVRPVAFENVFDEASVKSALAAPSFTKPNGTDPVKFQMVWSLEGPDKEAPAQPAKGAAQPSTKTAKGARK